MSSSTDPAVARPRVLVANRGEIAVRVVTACRRLEFESVVAVSAADLDSLAARLADRVVRLGPAQASRSYLRPELIAQAALQTGCDIVHPGYGFLSEKAELAELLEREGIAFAGPRSQTLRDVGDKAAARRVAVATGVPVAPASEVGDAASARVAAAELGYPVLLKAVHGGGGRGIHRVDGPDDLARLVDVAAAEARAAASAVCSLPLARSPASRSASTCFFSAASSLSSSGLPTGRDSRAAILARRSAIAASLMAG
jgi:acetyl-CoA carboxylase biotin carboxylase subunit